MSKDMMFKNEYKILDDSHYGLDIKLKSLKESSGSFSEVTKLYVETVTGVEIGVRGGGGYMSHYPPQSGSS